MERLDNLLAISIKGASHYESGKPMQDYSVAVKSDEFAVAVVCDGHGSDKHFRSEIGSELCAKITQDKLIEFWQLNPTYAVLQENFTDKVTRLKLSILAAWQNQIAKYTAENPFTEEELKKASPRFIPKMSFNVSQAYGTTLLASLIAKDYYLVLMLGDGAIARFGPNKSAEVVTFEDKKVYNDQPHSATDSLCSEDAFFTIFHTCKEIKADETVLAFCLCSDGFSEAFPSDDAMIRKMYNYLEYYAETGLEEAIPPIEAQLNEISRRSPMKDDISLAYATLDLSAFVEKPVVEVPAEPSEPVETNNPDKPVEASTDPKPEKKEDPSDEKEVEIVNERPKDGGVVDEEEKDSSANTPVDPQGGKPE